MKVLVLWADNRSANLGVRALAEGTADFARRVWGAETEVDFQDFAAGDSEVHFTGRGIARDVLSFHGPIRERLGEFDLVLDCGAGDSFADIYGLKRLLTMRYAQRLTVREDIPLVLGLQTIGPFESRLGIAVARATLREASAVLARDSISAENARVLGVVPIVGTDVVFALPQPQDVETTRDVLFNVSGLLWSGSNHVDPNAYRAAVVETVHKLMADGRRVSLLAHVLPNPSSDNDQPALEAVANSVGDGIEILVPDSLDAARRTIAGASLVIGSRMHACLNSLSVGVPTISWAYSRKFAPLMRDLGWHSNVDLRTDDISKRTLALAAKDTNDDEVSAVRRRAESRLTSAVEALQERQILFRTGGNASRD